MASADACSENSHGKTVCFEEGSQTIWPLVPLCAVVSMLGLAASSTVFRAMHNHLSFHMHASLNDIS